MDDDELKGLIATPAIENEEPRLEETPPAAEAEAAPAAAEGATPDDPARGSEGTSVAEADANDLQVPLLILLDERDRRRAAEKALADLKARDTPPQTPDPAEALQQALYEQNRRSSRRFAEQVHGKDVIAQVHDWAAAKCDADPLFNQLMRTSDDPYEAAKQAWDQEQILTQVKPADLEDFKAWRAAQANPAPAEPTPAPPSPLPKSLATAPGNGAAGKVHTPTGPGEAFNATIPR